jgi:hypothetical protein
MQLSNFYIYEHIRPDTNQVFYVGKGKGNRCNSLRRNIYWKRIVAKAGGFNVRKIVENIDEELAFLAEQERIDQIKRLGYVLCNATNGGEGVSGYKHTDKTKAALSIVMKNTMQTYAKVLSQKQMGENNSAKKKGVGEKISKALIGRKLPEETKKKISQPRAKNPKARIVEYNGQVFGCIKDLADYLGINYRTVLSRMRYNIPLEAASK